MNFSKSLQVIAIILITILFCSWTISSESFVNYKLQEMDSLRALYSRDIALWPKPNIDLDIEYKEMAPLPIDDTSWLLVDKDVKVKLGQLLFFDPRLSSSNQISCSSCHDPEIGWGDARRTSLGNDHLQGTRNTPSLLNVYTHNYLFWDGRAKSLEDQAIGPIGTHHEMNMNADSLPQKIQNIEGYRKYFKLAYCTEKITMVQILNAIASFEKIIKSRQSRFDRFLRGSYSAISDQEIKGLDLFRGKARCMNCHYGTFLTDEQFHNIGLSYYGRKFEDLGRFNITKNAQDVGKFKTPSLRDVVKTGPWMHNGLFDNLEGVINIYNSGMHQLDNRNRNLNDTLYPHTDPILQPLNLSQADKISLIAFLNAITATQYKMRRPELPK